MRSSGTLRRSRSSSANKAAEAGAAQEPAAAAVAAVLTADAARRLAAAAVVAVLADDAARRLAAAAVAIVVSAADAAAADSGADDQPGLPAAPPLPMVACERRDEQLDGDAEARQQRSRASSRPQHSQKPSVVKKRAQRALAPVADYVKKTAPLLSPPTETAARAHLARLMQQLPSSGYDVVDTTRVQPFLDKARLTANELLQLGASALEAMGARLAVLEGSSDPPLAGALPLDRGGSGGAGRRGADAAGRARRPPRAGARHQPLQRRARDAAARAAGRRQLLPLGAAARAARAPHRRQGHAVDGRQEARERAHLAVQAARAPL